MKAARTFTWGPEDGDETDRVRVRAGEEIPKKILSEIPDKLVLEKVAKTNPKSLSREQLLDLAGVSDDEDDDAAEEDETTPEELREALGEFTTKQSLAEWALENFDIELDTDNTRDVMEDAFIEAYFAEDEPEE